MRVSKYNKDIGKTMEEDRKSRIVEKLPLKRGAGLELGPLSRPTVSRSESNIYYADHMSLRGLKKKYKHTHIVLEDIAPVDFIIKGKSLAADVKGKKFDYVIASHVIEHIPDTISWLKDVAQILKPGGILSLVIPDKRYTFDITRDLSKPADILGAYFDKNKRFTSRDIYDFLTNARADVIPGQVFNNPTAPVTNKPIYNEKLIHDLVKRNATGKEYIDCHCFVFSPASFFAIFRELINWDLLDYEIVGFHDTAPNDMEFFVSLKKSTKTKAQKLRSIPKLPAPLTEPDLQRQILVLENKLNEVYGSNSWRITRPMRGVVGKIKRQRLKLSR